MQLPNNWRPRPHQLNLWSYLEHGGRRAIAICHRRWGKDDVALHHAACAAHERVGTYWHCLPEFAQARKAIWTAVNSHTGKRRIDEAFPLELRGNTNEQEMFIRFKNGSTWQVIGSDNYKNLVGTGAAGIVFSEWARANPAAWAYLAPILVENNGWSVFITTPLGRNHAKSMYDIARADERWFAELQTVEDSQALSPEVIEEQRAQYRALYGDEAGDALIEQEYYCSFNAAILGAYFAQQLRKAREQGRVGKVPLDPARPVNTFWDIGKTDSTAIWFHQNHGQMHHLIDYYEASGEGVEFYARILREKAQERGWVYGKHYGPHDLDNSHWLLPGNDAVVDVARNLGIDFIVVPRIANKMDAIEAGRNFLSMCWIDEERCVDGLNVLESYRKEWDEVRETWKSTPLHDWASHGADALMTGACGFTPDFVPPPTDKYHRTRPRGSAWAA